MVEIQNFRLKHRNFLNLSIGPKYWRGRGMFSYIVKVSTFFVHTVPCLEQFQKFYNQVLTVNTYRMKTVNILQFKVRVKAVQQI